MYMETDIMKSSIRLMWKAVLCLLVWAAAGFLAAVTPPVRAEEPKESQKGRVQHIYLNDWYRVSCEDRRPAACENLIILLQSLDRKRPPPPEPEEGPLSEPEQVDIRKI